MAWRRGDKFKSSETAFRLPSQGISDWRYELQRFLIAGGTNGHMQTIILQRLQNWIGSDEIKAELEALLLDQKVQKFCPSNNGRGRPKTIWRATTKLLEK